MKKRLFAKIPAVLLAGLMLLSFAACDAPPAPSSQASSDQAIAAQANDGVITPTSDVKVAEASPEEIANASLPDVVYSGETDNQQKSTSTIQKELVTTEKAESIAGGKVNVYRGTIMDFAVNDAGQTVWILAQDIGTDYGAPFLNVAVTPELLTGSVGQQADIANNTHLEIFYTEMKTPEGGLTPEVNAVAANVLLASDMTIFNGKVAQVIPDAEKPGYGSIEVDPLDVGEKTIFHYSPETVFEELSVDTIKSGDELHILTNGISTRSLPPQSSALMIRPYVLCESCPTVPK